MAIGGQSSLGTEKSIFPLHHSRSCAGDWPKWNVKEEGATAGLQDAAVSPGSHLRSASFQPPHFAQQNGQKSSIAHFYLQLFSSLANFIATTLTFLSIFNIASYVFGAGFW